MHHHEDLEGVRAGFNRYTRALTCLFLFDIFIMLQYNIQINK